MLTLVPAQDQSTWTMLDAVEMRIISLTALIVCLLTVPIATWRMLESDVKVCGVHSILHASTDSMYSDEEPTR